MAIGNQFNFQQKNINEEKSLSTDIKSLIAKNAKLQELYSQLHQTNQELQTVYEFLKTENEKLQWELNELTH